MKKYRWLTNILVILFAAGILFNFLRHFYSDETAKELTFRKKIFPQSEHFSNKTGILPHYQAYSVHPESKLKELAGILFVTTDITPDIQGYAGPIKLMVGLDVNGRIVGSEIISHNETPAYVTHLNKFLQQFHLKGLQNKLRLGYDIDGITRATMTSDAITRSIQRGRRLLASEVLGLKVEHESVPQKPFKADQVIITCLLFLIAVIGVLRTNHLLRWTALLGGLIYFGLIQSAMVSIVQFINIGLGKVPSFFDHPLWYCLIGLTILSLFTLGNIYCSSLCPFAGLQEILYKIFKRLRPKKFTIDEKLLQKARTTKFIILFILIVLSFMIGKADPANIEVFILLFSFNATPLAWTFIALMLIISIFHYRFWCRYLCPLGALNGLLSRFSLFKIGLDKGCGGCEACAKLCPTDAIEMKAQRPIIDYAECILCGKCMEKCPKGTLHFQNPLNKMRDINETQ